MSEISKININGTIYDIKDVTARADAQKAKEDHAKLVSQERTDNQYINSKIQFNQGILLDMGASVSDDGETVTFK